MRNSLCSLALSSILAVAGSAAFAQSDNSAQQLSATQPAASQSTMPTKEHHAATPDEQAARLAKHLKLSADQENQIKPILADRQQQMQALHQDKSLNKQDKAAKMKSLRDDSNGKIEALLNDAQKQKFEAMQAKRQQRMQEHKSGAAQSGSAS